MPCAQPNPTRTRHHRHRCCHPRRPGHRGDKRRGADRWRLRHVWRAELADGREVVVKIGPPPRVPLLGYERGLLAAEADYFRLVAGRAPVPQVLSEGDGWLITSLLPGRSLADDRDNADPVRAELGAAVARIHEVTG